jgi:chaperonin cofactor prefoldin
VENLEAQTAEIETDQERVRRNLAAVPATDALHGRLLRQLEALETRMQALRRSQEQARTAAEQAQRELEAAIGRLAL